MPTPQRRRMAALPVPRRAGARGAQPPLLDPRGLPQTFSTTAFHACLAVSLLVLGSPNCNSATDGSSVSFTPPTASTAVSSPSASFSLRVPTAVVVADAFFWRKCSERLFCGEENCYTILGLQENSRPSSIRMAYKSLTARFAPVKPQAEQHEGYSEEGNVEKTEEGGDERPKRAGNPIPPEKREEMRQKVELAFSVLRDPHVRAAYDAFLHNPDGFLTFISSFRRCHQRLLSVVSAFLLVLLFASVAQLVHHSFNRENTLRAVKNSDWFQKSVRRISEERYGPKIRRIAPKEEEKLKKAIIDELVKEWDEENDELLPELATSDFVIVQFFFLPWHLFKFVHSNVRWYWLFNVCGVPYGTEERTYLTKKALNMSEKEWAKLKSADAEHYVSLELWEEEKLQKFLEDTEEKDRESRIQSGKYRQLKRRARKGTTPYNYNED